MYSYILEVIYKGQRLYFDKSLHLLKGIDLSANLLAGEIPTEIGFLSAIVVLNLSRNHIGGSIPDKLGRITVLESLDLSWNNLSGLIPHSLTSLTLLSFLNLSYNDLSGMIPSGNQLDTLDGDSYLGNANLCGTPLSRICVPESNKHRHRKHQLRFDMLTYLFTLLGFAFGISAVSTTIICSNATRMAYFQFTDRVLHKFRNAVEMKLSINRMSAGREPSLAIRSQDSITCYELEQNSTAII
jgi:hypothetical protein